MFWVAAAVVFLVNAVLSAGQSEWALAVLQLVTGGLALVSAATAAQHRGGLPGADD